MERRIFLIGLLVGIILCGGCAKKEKDDGIRNFKDDAFHFALYTNPHTDCISCVEQGIHFLLNAARKKQKGHDDKVAIFMKSSADSTAFENYVLKNNPDEAFRFITKDLPIAHPSIILFKGGTVRMYFHLSADIYDLKDSLDACTDFFSGLEIK